MIVPPVPNVPLKIIGSGRLSIALHTAPLSTRSVLPCVTAFVLSLAEAVPKVGLLRISATPLLAFQSELTCADGIVGLFLIKSTFVLSLCSQSLCICASGIVGLSVRSLYEPLKSDLPFHVDFSVSVTSLWSVSSCKSDKSVGISEVSAYPDKSMFATPCPSTTDTSLTFTSVTSPLPDASMVIFLFCASGVSVTLLPASNSIVSSPLAVMVVLPTLTDL